MSISTLWSILWIGVITLAMISGAHRIRAGEQQVVEWDAATLYQVASSRGVILSAEAIELEDRFLVEDDAPAFGYSVEGNSEVISGDVILRKELHVDRWPVSEARIVMLVYPHEPPVPNSGRHLVFRVNGGEDILYEVNHFWTSVPIPAGQLRQGMNTIEVRAHEPDTAFRTLIALDQHFSKGSTTRLSAPGRSQRSLDAGKTWQSELLGEKNTSRGEYPIRLSLHARAPEGTITSPVVDLGESFKKDGLASRVLASSVRFQLTASRPEQTRIEIAYRTGPSHRAGGEGWTEWLPAGGVAIPLSNPDHRFLQVRIRMRSETGDMSPRLAGLSVHAEIEDLGAGDLRSLHVLGFHNRPVGIHSADFPLEDALHPALVEFRQAHELDKVVAGARTEFEEILLLKHWVSSRWDWYLPGENYADFSAWDARRILQPEREDQPKGGYCLQYAIVFAQACQSFGHPARVMSANYSIWGGHEMAEVWSNDYAKWVLMDAQFDTVFFDKRSGVPLSALELHRLFLDHYFPNGEVVDRDNWPREDMVRRANLVNIETLPVTALIGGGGRSQTLREYEWWKPTVDLEAYCGGYGMFNLAELRFLPRSNFLSQPLPMPLNHGLGSHWGWDGYLCWYSPQVSRTPEHRVFTNREADLYWPVNGADLFITAQSASSFRVELETHSPNFSHFVVLAHGESSRVDGRGFVWSLAPGFNRLEVRVADALGNLGPISWIEVSRMNQEPSPIEKSEP